MALPSPQTRGAYTLTNLTSSIPLPQLNALFSQPDFHWGKPLSVPQLQKMLNNSICFAILTNTDTEQQEIVGFGRMITDHVSVAYINDIYIKQSHRNKGLASWMLECMDEALSSMPDLRGTIMIAERGSGAERLYKARLGMEELGGRDVLLDRKGRGAVE